MKAKTAFITKSVIGNDTINMYIVALSGVVVLDIDVAASLMLNWIFCQCDGASVVSVDNGWLYDWPLQLINNWHR
jgi:hypothetical protein